HMDGIGRLITKTSSQMSTPPEIVIASQIVPHSANSLPEANTWKAPTGLALAPERPIKVIRPPTFSITTIATGLRTLVQYSDLLYTLSLFRLNVRYKQSALGWTWAALQPLALMGIYTVIFTRVKRVSTGGTP